MIPHSGAEPLGALKTGTYATFTEELTINTPERYQIVCITNDVAVSYTHLRAHET